MDWYGRSLRMGAAAIGAAILLRMGVDHLPQEVGWANISQEAASFVIYLETGRVTRPLPQTTETTEATPPSTAPTAPRLPEFSAEDAALVYLRGTGETPDPEDLIGLPLELDLSGNAPTVLILHTHATESYTKTSGQDYSESSAYRTLDTDYNMVAIGAYLAQLLEAQGIRVIHDTTLHDHPQYTGSYDRSEVTVQTYLEQYPTIQLVLDLHRDAIADDRNGQLDTSATVDGRESAQIMLLLGTDHENWAENMNLAVKLTALLEKNHPGITRGILTRDYEYNHQLSPGALLVEMGAAGNTQTEALVAAEALAEAILTLRFGA